MDILKYKTLNSIPDDLYYFLDFKKYYGRSEDDLSKIIPHWKAKIQYQFGLTPAESNHLANLCFGEVE